MRLTARRLTASHRGALLEHFRGLSRRDAYLRFGSHTADAVIEAYVLGIEFASSTVLGVFGAELELLGVAHLCPADRGVELGISVLARARREGIGTLLLRRALGHARLVGALRLFMHCLAENDELMRLARRAGARIQVSHDEADGFIEVPCATAFSAAMELAAEHAGVAEYVCKAQRAAWRQALRR